jgi:hypothetical protein
VQADAAVHGVRGEYRRRVLRFVLALAILLGLAVPASAQRAMPCGTVGSAEGELRVSKAGPVTCRRAREIVRVRVVRGRGVPGWRCIHDREGLVTGWTCHARNLPQRVIDGRWPSEVP